MATTAPARAAALWMPSLVDLGLVVGANLEQHSSCAEMLHFLIGTQICVTFLSIEVREPPSLLDGDGPDGDRLLEDPFNSREECSRLNQFETRESVSLLGAVTDYSTLLSPKSAEEVSVLVTEIIPHSKEISGSGRGEW